MGINKLDVPLVNLSQCTIQVIVATIAFGMGIDKLDVPLVNLSRSMYYTGDCSIWDGH